MPKTWLGLVLVASQLIVTGQAGTKAPTWTTGPLHLTRQAPWVEWLRVDPGLGTDTATWGLPPTAVTFEAAPDAMKLCDASLNVCRTLGAFRSWLQSGAR